MSHESANHEPLADRAPDAADLLLRLGDALVRPDMVKARRWFDTIFIPRPYKEWSEDNASDSEPARYFRMVTGHWQLVATLWKHGYLPSELIFTNAREFRRTWEKCRSFVGECRAGGYGQAYLREWEEMCEAFDAWLAESG